MAHYVTAGVFDSTVRGRLRPPAVPAGPRRCVGSCRADRAPAWQ